MNNSDLADIRAQLRAAAEDRRPTPRGLRALLGARPRPPLLAGPMACAARPAPRPSAQPSGWEDEPLLLDEPIDLPLRRNSFGQKPDAVTPPPVPSHPLLSPPIPPAAGEDDMIEAILRRRSPLLRRTEEATETPFHPEDLADASEDDIERVYADAGLAQAPPTPAAPVPAAPNSPLLRLERRLLEEHLLLIRAIAGV